MQQYYGHLAINSTCNPWINVIIFLLAINSIISSDIEFWCQCFKMSFDWFVKLVYITCIESIIQQIMRKIINKTNTSKTHTQWLPPNQSQPFKDVNKFIQDQQKNRNKNLSKLKASPGTFFPFHVRPENEKWKIVYKTVFLLAINAI